MWRPIAVVSLFAAALAGPAAARSVPALSILARTPLTVAGSHFTPGAKIVVTVESLRLATRAGATGRFRLSLPGLRLGPCSTPRVRALGAHGEAAVAKVPAAGCMTARG